MATKKTTTAKKTSTDKRNDQEKEEFPGYPKYNPQDDITRQGERIDENLDDEVLTQVKHNKEPKVAADEPVEEPDDKAPGDFDVTEEDLEALGPKDLSMDGGEDEQLAHRTTPVDFTGKDLDVPGSELDDEREETGAEDEENNSYSLGGDGKSNIEESQEHERGL